MSQERQGFSMRVLRRTTAGRMTAQMRRQVRRKGSDGRRGRVRAATSMRGC